MDPGLPLRCGATRRNSGDADDRDVVRGARNLRSDPGGGESHRADLRGSQSVVHSPEAQDCVRRRRASEERVNPHYQIDDRHTQPADFQAPAGVAQSLAPRTAPRRSESGRRGTEVLAARGDGALGVSCDWLGAMLFSPYVAVLDIVLVFLIFKGDVKL